MPIRSIHAAPLEHLPLLDESRPGIFQLGGLDTVVATSLALLVCVVLPAFVVIHRWGGKRSRGGQQEPEDLHYDIDVSFAEALSLARLVRPFLTSQVAFGACYLFMTSWWNAAMQVMVDHWTFYSQIHAVHSVTARLPDIGFHLLPHIKTPHLADAWNAAELGITALAFIGFHPQRAKILRRFCFLQGTLFMLRSVTICVTLLPNPYELCSLKPQVDESFAMEGLKVMGGTRYTCGDVMYSGHSVNMTLMNLAWQEYFPRHWRLSGFIRSFWWFVNLGGLAMCIATRFHYTVDVIIGSVIAYLVWSIYHRTVRTPQWLGEDSLIYHFLRWYETDSGVTCCSRVISMQEGLQLTRDDSGAELLHDEGDSSGQVS